RCPISFSNRYHFTSPFSRSSWAFTPAPFGSSASTKLGAPVRFTAICESPTFRIRESQPANIATGPNSGTISECFATGAVKGKGSETFVGGLVGGNYGTVMNSYARG